MKRTNSKPITTKGALLFGSIWGFVMLMFSVFLNPLLFGKSISYEGLPIQIPLWIIGGILLGFANKYFHNKLIVQKELKD